jgi:hypothetical protein
VVKEKVLRTFGAIRVGSNPTPCNKLFYKKSLTKKNFLDASLSKKFDKKLLGLRRRIFKEFRPVHILNYLYLI